MRQLSESIRSLRTCTAAVVLTAWAGAASAQFAMVPAPMQVERPASDADNPLEYRRDAARHLYASFPMRIYRGKMPPLLYGVAIVDVEVDAQGNVLDVFLRRPPAAPEVGPWVLSMIRRAAPFPMPARLGEKVGFSEIWLVDKGGNFQLDTLTEGQR
jgi:outer membrane biosynthesis protein TonB